MNSKKTFVVRVTTFAGSVGYTVLALAGSAPAMAAELPIPCLAGSCGGNIPWVSAGAATGNVNGNTLNINQTTSSVSLNWQSFNIGADGRVNFAQPDASSIALNRIFQNDPSRILGQLNANGQVYLLNQNGIVFGQGSQVNVGGLIASTLNITPSAETLGLLAPLQNGEAAFTAVLGSDGKSVSKDIRIEQGAKITTPAGGRVLVFAPNVTNEGEIKTPDGQTALAAGERVFLMADNSGLVVEVGGGGTATNIGQIKADHGSVSLVGLAVNQLGRITASTAVRQAGRIQLKARESRANTIGSTGTTPTVGGSVVFGANSVTDASPDVSDKATTLDANPQPKGTVSAVGDSITMRSGSQIVARGGAVSLNATRLGDETEPTGTAGTSRILLESGSKIDVSGLTVDLAAARNALTVKLQGDELKDRPSQRDGALYRKEVTVDLRKHGRLADGTEWVGTPLADLRQAAQGVPRTVAERNTAGGTVDIRSAGEVVLANGATIDVSGGAVNYAGGQVQTTQLIRAGKIIDISEADPNVAYDGMLGDVKVTHNKWGVIETFGLFGTGSRTGPGPGAYTEGRDAGSIGIAGPNAILEGNLIGHTTRGIFQRAASDLDVARGGTRAFDEMARGAHLTVGIDRLTGTGTPDFVTGDVTIGVGTVEQGVSISPQLFANGVNDIHIFSNGRIDLPVGTSLDLGLGATLQLVGAEVNVEGTVIAHGGDVSIDARLTALASPDLNIGQARLAEGSLIDVSGQWINETPAVTGSAGADLSPVVIDGGSVTVEARGLANGSGGLKFEEGARIVADGGAHMTLGDTLHAGRGGSISLASHRASNGAAPETVLDGEVTAFAVTNGGTLSILGPNICISNSDCGERRDQQLDFTPERFTRGGFAQFNLTAEGGALTVAKDTTVNLRQDNFILRDDARTFASGASLFDFSDIGALPDYDRNPTGLSLSTTLVAGAEASKLFNDQRLLTADILSIETGAQIAGEAGASISLRSSSRLYVDGEISAPAGSISLTLDAANVRIDETSRFADPITPITQLAPAQTLWLGSNARLLARGDVELVPNSAGLRLGTVRDAGSVSLRATSGYVVTEAGSLIDVSATSADLDLTSGGSIPSATRTTINGAAGRVDLLASEGMLLDGDLRATPVGDGFAGSLTVTLDAQRRADSGDQQVAASFGLPTNARTIVLTDRDQRVVPATQNPGTVLPTGANGTAVISAKAIERAGFGNVRLDARNVVRTTTSTVAPGVIRFQGSPLLALSGRLELMASGIQSDGGTATLSAPYIALGNDNAALDARFRDLPGLISGNGGLELQATTIDLIGSTRLLGFDETNFRASEDIRLRGLHVEGQSRVIGSLESTGDLGFTARQIYPTTLSEFTVAVRNNDDGAIRIAATGASTPLLSAGGAVRFEAAAIEQGGRVKAPLGSITFNAAKTLDLLPGSLTSTSLENQLVPFGRVQLGADWIYSLDKDSASLRLVFNEAGDRPADEFPTQRVQLQGPEISLAAGAVVDESGGGDLQAYEFKPGLGGTVDILATNNTAGAFAIVPALGGSFAPIDPQEYVGFNVQAGTSVDLAGAAGLPAGRYAILPARYALLPGAFLVTPTKGYIDLRPGETLNPAGGGTVVSGRTVFANGSQGASHREGFLIRPGSDIAKLATYDIRRANESAALFDAARLPRDGGVLQVSATSRLELGGMLRSIAGKDGRGAAAEFTGTNLAIVSGSDTSGADPNALLIDAQGLNALGAESVLLGGTIRHTADGAILDVTAQTVTVESGASLSAPELTLAATDTIRVKSGATVSGEGAGSGTAEDLSINGEGAFLRVAAGPQISVERELPDTLVKGTLSIEAGATIAADSAMLLDSTLDTRLAGRLMQDGGAMTLSASKISLGEIPASTGGLALSQSDLAGLSVDDFILRSRSGIDLFGSVSGQFKNLILDTPQIGGHGSADVLAQLNAETLTLTNSSLATGIVPATGTGRLSLSARDVNVDSGAIDISGFAGVSLAASRDVLATSIDGGALRVGGDLDITASRITGMAGSALSIASTGVLRSLGAGTAAAAIDALGAELSLSGKSVIHTGRIVMPSGTVSIEATGGDATDGVTIGFGGIVDVAGTTLQFADRTVFAPAGDVTLASVAGGVRVDSGAVVNLSAAGQGTAGTLTVRAPLGTLVLDGEVRAGAAAAADSGRVYVDVAQLANFSALNSALNAGQFLMERDIRVRTGDISVGASDSVNAQNVRLTADAGAIDVFGRIGTGGVQDASVELNALGDVRLFAGSQLNASVSGEGRFGGNVALNSLQGGVRLESGSVVNGGRLDIRVSRAVASTMADTDTSNDRLAFRGTVTGARQINLFGYETYEDADGHLDFADVAVDPLNVRFAEADAFMQTSGAIRAGLGVSGNALFHVRPGVTITTAAGSDLILDNDWDLSGWRFGGEAGELMLRSGRDLLFNASLSDGFQGVADLGDPFGFAPLPVLLSGESWSYRLVADGNLTIAPGVASIVDPFLGPSRPQLKAIRTGSGDIDIAVTGDVVLSNRASVIYTAGRDSQSGILLGSPGATGALEGRVYPTRGGDISVRAGGSVRGIAEDQKGDFNNYSNQLVTNWLYRQGSPAEISGSFPDQAVGWTVAHERFEQGIGALGGGDISVVAGGDVDNLSVVVPTIGRQVGGTTLASSVVEIDGGGNIDVRAGGDIRSGVFYVGRGQGTLQADGGIVSGRAAAFGSTTALHTILAVEDGHFSLSARGNVDLEGVVNPTLIPQSSMQRPPFSFFTPTSFFNTYADSAGVSLTSLVGDVTLHNGLAAMVEPGSGVNPFALDFLTSPAIEPIATQLYAPSLEAAALQGSIDVRQKFTLFPSEQGDVQLLARQDVRLGDKFVLSDADANLLPSLAAPSLSFEFFNVLNPVEVPLPSAFASRPVHTGDSDPVRIVAALGDITYEGPGNNPIFLSKSATIVAGRDISNLNVLIQNIGANDVSSIRAGRDLIYPIGRSATGNFNTSLGSVRVQGPGRLNVEAGRNIDLGVSDGLVSLGNTLNAALADEGADISVAAGLGSGSPAYAAFAEKYLKDRYDAVATAYGLEAFRALSAEEKSRIVYAQLNDAIYDAFAKELRETGRKNAPLPADERDYSRGDTAVATLFPAATTYKGDLSLFFSRIYTLDGGNVDLMTPGGFINVGLSTPVRDFGIRKQAQELGIVAQSSGSVRAFLKGDFAVNESRVFAADGGDILIWSSDGNIDAGRGAKTAISAPPPTVTIDPVSGAVRVVFPPALTGSGLRTLTTTPGRAFGSVDLITPRGFVDASEAGIESQGNVTIAAERVLGVDNIKVGGIATGVPVDTGGLGASLASASSVGNAASDAASAVEASTPERSDAPLSDSAMSWLDVFVEGFGEEVCKPNDAECLRRQTRE